ncbi:MAG: diacylglycerol/lipid kinase family protein [Candidatus Izemoplasmataceae bacterium]
MKKCTLIYNPVSGKKKFVDEIPYVVDRLNNEGYEVSIKKTRRKKDAIYLSRNAAEEQVDLLIIAGGDGTLHECINGLAEAEYVPKVGYLPSGTACDIAGTLKISKNIKKAMDVILEDEVEYIDLVKSNHGYFMYVTAMGTYVDISYVTDSRLKKYIGYFAYILTGIKEFFTIPMIKTKIEHDEGVIRGYFSLIMVVNSKKVAGFNIVQKPILNDGKVDVVLYRYIPLFNNLLYFISFLLSPTFLPGVQRFRSSKLRITTDHHHKWNTDGEESNAGNVNIEVKQRVVPLIINKKIKRRYFKEEYKL